MPERWIARERGGPEKLELEAFESLVVRPGQVAIKVKAVGMNPADLKQLAGGADIDAGEPMTLGFEVAGIISAIGEGTEIQTGPAQVGDAVLAFQLRDGYSTEVVTDATNVFAKPSNVSFPEAANLLLAGTTAADLLRRGEVGANDVVLVHGASGAVGNSVVEQARLLGARVIATSGEAGFERLKAFGAEPVRYGPGLEDRVRSLSPAGVDVALDTVGSDEAVLASLNLTKDRSRIVTIVAKSAAEEHGFIFLGSGVPGSEEFRESVRGRLVEMAALGSVSVHVAQTFPFADAVAGLTLLGSGHPGGKLALVV